MIVLSEPSVQNLFPLCMLSNSVTQLLSLVQLFAAGWTVACQALLFMGLQARILVWVVMLSSRGSSQPRDQTCVSYVSYTSKSILYH